MEPRDSYHVLFLCEGNSARSIFGEALMQRHGKGRFHSYSAGRHPLGHIHPLALQILKQNEHPTQELHSKSWNEFLAPGAPSMDFVFTVCDIAADEECPVWPGKPITARWDIEDPARFKGPETEHLIIFRRAYRELERRIEIFVNLPFDSLSRLSLQARVDDLSKGE
jgi:arsenate reductase